MLSRVSSLVRSAPKFGWGFLAGVLTILLFQWLLPHWRYEKLHYQNGPVSIQTLVRFDSYSGEVERLATSEPE